MKSFYIISVIIIVTLLFSGCTTNKSEEENILFTGIIESIEENTWLVSTSDDVGFDQASVTLTKDIKMPFNPLVGQTISFTILPEIRESYPVQVTAIAVDLVQTEEITFQYTKITPEEAKAILDSQDAFTLIDVRTQEEFDEGYIEGAILLPLGELETIASEFLPDLNQKILVYCRSGNRSETAARLLGELGYTNVLDFGGILDWPYEIIK
jgi:rhodanese-related sulfurtransferase